MRFAPSQLRRSYTLIGAGILLLVTGGCGEENAISDAQMGQAVTQVATHILPVESSTAPVSVTLVPTIPGEPPTPDPSQETPLPTPDPSSPYILFIEADLASPVPADELVRASDLIVEGTVRELLPAQWTTPDGRRPENPWVSVPDQFTIITPVIIELDLPLILDRVPEVFRPHVVQAVESRQVIVAAQGGAIQRDDEQYDEVRSEIPSQQYAVGERVIVALRVTPGGVVTQITTSAGVAYAPMMKYVLTDGGTAVSITSEGESSIPADELIANIQRAASQLPSIEVTVTPDAGIDLSTTPTP